MKNREIMTEMQNKVANYGEVYMNIAGRGLSLGLQVTEAVIAEREDNTFNVLYKVGDVQEALFVENARIDKHKYQENTYIIYNKDIKIEFSIL